MTITSKTWHLPALLLSLGIIPLLSVGYHFFTMFQGIAQGVPPADPSEQTYIDNPMPILLHLVPVIAFILLGPFQLTPRARARWPRLHRISGRIFVVAGVMAGLSGLYMNEIFPPIGGPAKYWGTMLFGVLMTLSVLLGLWAVRRRDISNHRAWMIRAYAIGIGATTQRIIIIPLFIYFGGLNDLTIGVAMWAGWTINLCVAEWIIARRLGPVFAKGVTP